MSGESLADLLLRVGVDSSDIVQGFANANRKAAQAGREMAETVNNALSRIEFTALGVNAQDAVRTATNTMLKEAIAARTIIERSASNVMIAGMTGVGGKTDSGDMIGRLNAFAVAERQKAESDMDVMKRYEAETEKRMEAVRQRQRAQLAESQREQQSALDQRIRLENEARNSQLEGERGTEEDRRKLFSQRLRERLQREADAAEEEQRRARELEETAAKRLQLQRLLQRQQEATNEKMAFENKLARERLEFEEQLRALGEDPRMTVVGSVKMGQFDEAQAARLAAFRTKEQIDAENQAERDRNRILKERENLQDEALRIVRATESAQDAHNRRLQRYEYLLKEGVLTQKEFNTAVKQSEVIMKSQNAGGGQMSGVLAQLSFGLEDFAQGIAMGDFRAAMLGASNNISMVIRGLKDMDAAGRASFITLMKFPLIAGVFVGIGVAALAIAHHIKNANTELKTLADRIAESTRQYFRFRQADEMATRRQRQSDELAKITEIEDIEAKRRQAELDHADLMRRLDTERNENNVKGREAILKMLGGEANMIELQQYLANKNTLESQMALQALSRAQQAALKGNAAVVFQEMRALFDYLDKEAFKDIPGKMTPQDMIGGRFLFDMAALNELQKYFKQGSMWNAFYGDSEEALKEVQGVLDEIAKDESKSLAERQAAERLLLEIKTRQGEIVAEQAEQEKFNAEQAERQHEIRKQRALFDAESFKRMQQEQIFLINATEHERELLRLKEQQSKVTRPGALLTGFDPIMNALMQQENENLQQQDRIAFLQAQRKAVENEIFQLQMQQVPKPQGALEQNAFQAQASAFKQMMENANQKPNPQMTRMISLLQSIDAAMQNGGIIQGVP